MQILVAIDFTTMLAALARLMALRPGSMCAENLGASRQYLSTDPSRCACAESNIG